MDLFSRQIEKVKSEQTRKLVMFLLCLILLGLSPIGIASAEQATSSTMSISRESVQKRKDTVDLNQWAKDTGDILVSPKHWKSSDWNNCLLYGGLTYLISENDKHIQSWFQGDNNSTSHTDSFATVGNALPYAGIAYMTGAYFLGNEKQRQFATTGLESVAITTLFTEVAKAAIHKQRPDGSDNSSFPSWHAASAFALATVFADEYSKDKAVPYIAYGLASLTAYGRLKDNKHWASDIFIGALIGHYTAKSVIALNKSHTLQLQPYATSNTVGLVVSKQY